MIFFLLAFFITLFLAEGLGFERSLFLYFYLCLPAMISFFLLLWKKSVFFPKKTSIVFLIYLLIAFFSLIFSVDKQNSFELFLFYISSFLIFVFFYNFKNEAKKLVTFEIIFGSLIFSLYFLLSFFFPSLKSLQSTGYQLVKSVFGLHNHLGDYLGLAIIYFLSFKNYGLSVLFLPFFLLSYSRSSYLSLILVLFVYWWEKGVNYSKKIFFIVISLILFFWVLTLFFQKIPALEKTFKFIYQTETVKTKDLFSGRNSYFGQIKSAFLKRPFLGYGMGNFGYLSFEFRQEPGKWTETTHNIFLEELVGTGILGFLAFLFFVFLILKNAKKNSLFFFLLIYLLINFQTDYTYKIFSVFVFFMILLGIINEEKPTINEKISKRLFFGISLCLLIIVQQIIYSRTIFLLGKTKMSLLAYPLNKEALKTTNSNWYLKLYPFDTSTIGKLARLNEKKGDYKKALSLYEENYRLNPFDNFDLIKEIYRLRKKLNNVEKARIFAGKELKKYKKLPEWVFSKEQKKQIRDFCDQADVFLCDKIGFSRFEYFYEPDPKSHKKVLKQVPYPESYTINKDALNERFDYSIKKPADIFRIAVLGDSSTFGLLVKTKDNWTEKIEDLLNQRINNPKIKKIEVINLAVHGYDIPYEVERFRRRGLKYNPDLVLWFISDGNFFQFNEVMFEKMGRIEEEMNKIGELEKEIAKGNYYPAWEKALEETKKEIGEAGYFSIIKSYLDSFRQDYTGNLIIIGPSLSEKVKQLLTEALGEEKVYFNSISSINDQQYHFPKYGQINELGHQMISNEVFHFIMENKLIQL